MVVLRAEIIELINKYERKSLGLGVWKKFFVRP